MLARLVQHHLKINSAIEQIDTDASTDHVHNGDTVLMQLHAPHCRPHTASIKPVVHASQCNSRVCFVSTAALARLACSQSQHHTALCASVAHLPTQCDYAQPICAHRSTKPQQDGAVNKHDPEALLLVNTVVVCIPEQIRQRLL
eukprot:1071-Heterococcus_DN1.PRE.2